MNLSVIITKKAGEIPPRGYIQEALKNCPTCYGIAIQDKNDGNSVLDVITSATSMDIDKMMTTLEAIKDCQAVITLGNMTQDFDKDDDLMPFVFEQASEGETDPPEKILAIFIEGDAPNYTKAGEGHTESYNFWEDFICPTLMEKFEASADLPSFYDKLKTSAFQQSILNPFGHRGVVVFVPVEGDIIAYGKNELGAEFPWGTTSNTFLWSGTNTFATKAAAVVGKAKSRLAAITGSTASPAATSTDDKGIHHIKMDTTVVPPKPEIPVETTPMKPPTKLQGNGRNAWIRLFTNTHEGPMPVGHSHADYVIHVPNNLVQFAARDVSTKDQVKSLAKEVVKVQGRQAPISNDAIAAAHEEAIKINEAKPTVQDPSKVEPRKTEVLDYLPDTTADEAKKAAEMVTEWATLPKRPPVLEVQRIESKWPAFSKKHGITLKDMLGWTIAERKRLCRELPGEAALAMGELALWAIDHGALGATEMEINTEKANDRPIAPAPGKQVEVQPAPAVPAPAAAVKKSRLAAITGKAA